MRKPLLNCDLLIRAWSRFSKWTRWHAPELLGLMGIIGVGATAVTSAIAGRKAMKARMDAIFEKGEPLTTSESIKTEGKYYIPPAIVGLTTMASIYGGMKIGVNQRRTLLTTVGALILGAKKFQQDTREKMGDEAFKELLNKQVEDKVKSVVKDADSKWLLDNHADKLIFLERNHTQLFEATAEEVRIAEYHLNRQFAILGSCSLNDFYDLLGIPKTSEGEILGWDRYTGEVDYGYYFIDFDHKKQTVDVTGNGDFIDVWVIDEPFEPTEDCGPYADYVCVEKEKTNE